MAILIKPLRSILFALTIGTLGCHAQSTLKSPGTPAIAAAGDGSEALSPEMARRIEVLIRSKSDVPPAFEIHVGPRTKSDVAGYDAVRVDFVSGSKAIQPLTFLLSKDGKTLAQFRKYDISTDPRVLVSGADRPARGGAADAPVLFVVFDDLECPYCADMNARIVPSVLERYKERVRIVYRDFPEDQHPWAMRAAIDANCVGVHSGAGYWDLIDYIHAHASEFGGKEHSLAQANESLDLIARDEAKKQKLDEPAVEACLARQDPATVKASVKEGDALGVSSTPTLYINGEKIEGAQPVEYIYRAIDEALVAAGQTPPPPAAKPVAQPAKTPAAPASAKPGS